MARFGIISRDLFHMRAQSLSENAMYVIFVSIDYLTCFIRHGQGAVYEVQCRAQPSLDNSFSCCLSSGVQVLPFDVITPVDFSAWNDR